MTQSRAPRTGTPQTKEGSPFSYERFGEIDGRHDFQKAVPDGFVDYLVRTRHGGELAYFNFELAKEMGLIPDSHPHQITPSLAQAVLETFSLVIINEWDQMNGKTYEPKDVRPHKYMATRYLQLQHPNKRGKTSGDGRSIWNGQIRHKGVTWDVSSCGTGATCLSPATAIHQKYFRTGDPAVSYGCGYASMDDGLSGGLMSEIFHRNGIPTERTLAIIQFKGKGSINVRAGRNLLRPSHLFRYLKLGDLDGLKATTDYFIARETANGALPRESDAKRRYQALLESVTRNFARAAALFESEYIFCWMDWDGDNILASDAGIIDYGSIRQFGLYHREYRYDDVERWSTSLPEQKRKARYIVQVFAQLVDFITTGRKRPIEDFRRHACLREFERVYWEEKHLLLLKRMGFSDKARDQLWAKHQRKVKEFRQIFSYFEEKQSARGPYEVPDGITSDAVYCMRDVLREVPKHLLAGNQALTPETFLELAASSYARPEDLKLTRDLKKKVRRFIGLYSALIERGGAVSGRNTDRMLLEVMMRSSILNQYDRITGNGILIVVQKLLKRRKNYSFDEFHALMAEFLSHQTLDPAKGAKGGKGAPPPSASPAVMKLITIVREYRESI